MTALTREPRRSKYGAKKTTYNGERYDSKLEARYAQQLDMRVRAGDIRGYTRQTKIPLVINDITVANYVIDFVIDHNDDTYEFVEVKGFPTALWKFKWKVAQALYPDETFTLITKDML